MRAAALLSTLSLILATSACRRGPRSDEREVAKPLDERAPRRVDAPSIVELFAGGEATCVRDALGELRCAGVLELGKIPDAIPRPFPTRVERLKGAARLAIARWSICAQGTDGAVDCHGPLYGRLPPGSAGDRRMFPPRGVDPRGVRAIATGEDEGCALIDSVAPGGGNVWCWGRNLFGEIGDGTLIARPIPTRVVGLDEIDEIAVGHGHACARLRGGFVKCWGRNEHGQLGDGTTTDRAAPVDARLAGATRLALGDSFTCVAMVDGSVRCFGDDDEGELGDGANTARSVPVAVRGLTGAIDVVAGEKHACARTVEGAVHCWGGNGAGQLGTGAGPDRSEAKPIGVIAEQLATGLIHTCARKGSRVVCWGSNLRGQLGDGTTIDRPLPVEGGW